MKLRTKQEMAEYQRNRRNKLKGIVTPTIVTPKHVTPVTPIEQQSHNPMMVGYVPPGGLC